MFIVVRFGDNEQRLFNINCRSRVLYENIKERCDCDLEECIDLADENAVVKGFPDHLSQDEYGTDFLQSRSTYILLQVQSTTTKNVISKTYNPLLNNISELFPDFMTKLYNKKVNPDVGVATSRPSSQRSVSSPKASVIGKIKSSLTRAPPSRGQQGRKSKATAF